MKNKFLVIAVPSESDIEVLMNFIDCIDEVRQVTAGVVVADYETISSVPVLAKDFELSDQSESLNQA